MSTSEEAREIAQTLYETLAPADRILLMRVINRNPKALYDELILLERDAKKDTPLSKIS